MGHEGATARDQWVQHVGVEAGDHVVFVGPIRPDVHQALARLGVIIDTVDISPNVQLSNRASLAVMPGGLPAPLHQAAVHLAVLHLQPGGHLAVLGAAGPGGVPHGVVAVACGDGWWLWRRCERRTVHDLLATARHSLQRMTVHDLHHRRVAGERICVVDTRTATDRDRYGTIEGALHVPRTVLEFNLDPANGYLHPCAPDFDDPLVVVCNGGYSSSFAAANLRAIGFSHAADLVGGMAAWIAAGLPVVAPDHCHLELPNAFGGCCQPVPTISA